MRGESGVEAGNPEATEVAFSETTAVIGVLTGVHDGFVGDLEAFMPSHPITFG